MNGEEKQRLLVTVLGINERTSRTLKMYFKGPCDGRYKIIEQHELAQCTLVDLDGLASPSELTDYRSIFPGRPLVLLGKAPLDEPEILFLEKPLQMQVLADTLERVRQQVFAGVVGADTGAELPPTPVTDAQRLRVRAARRLLQESSDVIDICGNHQDVDLRERRQRERVIFALEETWLARLMAAWDLARTKAMPVRLSLLSKPVIILPGMRKIVCTISDRELRGVAVVRADAQATNETLSETEAQFFQKLMASGKSMTTESIEPFLWRFALWTSRGRAPQKTDFDAPMFLRHWPNFTRLLLTPEALRIAALWLHQPHGLAATARVLDIPQRYVFSFYTATQVLDYSGTSRREADYLFAEPLPVAQHEQRGLFGRMLDRLSSSEKK